MSGLDVRARMKLHEYQAMRVLRSHGVALLDGLLSSAVKVSVIAMVRSRLLPPFLNKWRAFKA